MNGGTKVLRLVTLGQNTSHSYLRRERHGGKKTDSVVTGARSLKTVCARCCYLGVKSVKPFPAAQEPLGKVSRQDGSGNVTRQLPRASCHGNFLTFHTFPVSVNEPLLRAPGKKALPVGICPTCQVSI